MFVSSDRQKIVTTQSDTIMRYDANGNLIRDLDRGIHLQLFIRFHPMEKRRRSSL